MLWIIFSPKGKTENIGFLVYTLIILGHVPIYIFYIINKINPIKAYLAKEMETTGYITKNKQCQNSEDIKEKESIKEINFNEDIKIDKYSPPKRTEKLEMKEKEDSKDDELSIKQETIEIDSKKQVIQKYIKKENFITSNTFDKIIQEKVIKSKPDNKEHLMFINAQILIMIIFPKIQIIIWIIIFMKKLLNMKKGHMQEYYIYF